MSRLSRSEKVKILQKYIPEGAVNEIIDLQEKYRFHLRISKDRKTKLGDFRAPFNGRGYRISVNRGLNKYAFLLTLLHEIAHLITWEKYARKVNPHGEQWQENYKLLTLGFVGKNIFPDELERMLAKYLQNPAASCAADEHLMKMLRKYDANPPIYLEEIPAGAYFNHNKRVFQKGEKRRKRFVCLECSTNRKYLFSPVAEVELIKENRP